MTFTDAVRTCIGKYAVFSGRARRPEYWWFILATVLLGLVATLVDIVLGTGDAEGGLFAALTSLALLLPTLAVTWRRLHDVNRPGWLVFLGSLGLVPMLAAAGVALLGGPVDDAVFQSRFGLIETLMIISAVVTVAAMIFLLVLLVSRGTAGPNRFGAEPPPRRRHL